MELTGLIESAEKQFIQILEEYFRSIYDERKLPSHGLDHHRRVWYNVKQLLFNLPDKNTCIHQRLPSTLVIASYMHDLGMAIDHGPKHGRQSMELCRKFLQDNHLDEDDFPGLMHAIQEHDNKNYSSPEVINPLTLLAIADDLDAFGFTGIYRYTEIYLLRGMDKTEIGRNIRANAYKRFEHFRKIFEKSSGFFEEQEQKYLVLMNFFEEYDSEISDDHRHYYSDLIQEISDIIRNKQNVPDFITADHKMNPVSDWFFNGLSAELTYYH